MSTCTRISLEAVIAKHGGVLHSGKHDPSENGPCCILEAKSECLGIPWTDNPVLTQSPDLRGINDDSRWASNEVRTKWMVDLAEAVADWPTWMMEKRNAWYERSILRVARELIAARLEELKLPENVVAQWRSVATLQKLRALALALALDLDLALDRVFALDLVLALVLTRALDLDLALDLGRDRDRRDRAFNDQQKTLEAYCQILIDEAGHV